MPAAIDFHTCIVGVNDDHARRLEAGSRDADEALVVTHHAVYNVAY
jgi:hypothetical protein